MTSYALLVELPNDIRQQMDARRAHEADLECRSCSRISANCEGLLRITSQPRVLSESKEYQPDSCSGTLIKNISRTGIGVYYHQQLFPLQRIEVEFQGRVIAAVVVRCRYISKRCYEIGAIIDSVQKNCR